MMASTAAASLKSALAGVVASAPKHASSSSEPFLKWGFSRCHADAETCSSGMSSIPSFMWSFSTRTSMPNTGESRVHRVHSSQIHQRCLTDDLHAMDPLDGIKLALDEELKERTMCGSAPSSSHKLVFLGGPGVGKGTWASLLSKRLNIPHLSTGDLVRKELSKLPSSRTSASQLLLREQVRTAMNQGKLLPDSVILELLWNRLQEMDPSVGFILDGFPRTVCQAGILDDAVHGINMAVNFHLEDEALLAKCLGRRVCSECGKDYNLAHVDMCTHDRTDNGVMKHKWTFLPARPPPQECASKLEVRGDDCNETVVRERLRLYACESEPLKQHYRSQGRLVELDVGPGAEYVWSRLLDAIWELEHNSNCIVSSC
eukprot:c18302_g1_i2 orf=228-1346(-)